MYAAIRPFLFSLDPENAHHFTISSMKMASSMGLTAMAPSVSPSPREVMGLTFPNPVGLAAGLDEKTGIVLMDRRASRIRLSGTGDGHPETAARESQATDVPHAESGRPDQPDGIQ